MERMLTRKQARRFILAHQGLLANHRFEAKHGIVEFVERAGCLQFDPLNIVGRNQELVLQSRIKDFRPDMLTDLLYLERKLIDGWDKNMSIYKREDWPYFRPFRESNRLRLESTPHLQNIASQVLDRIAVQGPLSSGELEYDEVVDWSWAPTRLARAILESLYFSGELIVHHKIGTRKVYDLATRHLPAGLLQAQDPNLTAEQRWEWYVSRRIGAVGMLWNKASDAWLGTGMKSKDRNEAFLRLESKNSVIPFQVEGIRQPLYIRAEDVPLLERVMMENVEQPDRAFVLAPLDNMLWDRRLIKELFDFDYIWEVYVPAPKRRYGYYVLPVMCGDQFVGRFEPGFDRKNKRLEIKQWWWEPYVTPTEQMRRLLSDCFDDFARFVGARDFRLDVLT